MSDGLPGGKPFLGDGEHVPGVAHDIPRYLRGHPKGIHLALFQDRDNFIKPVLVVLFQFLNPFLQSRKMPR